MVKHTQTKLPFETSKSVFGGSLHNSPARAVSPDLPAHFYVYVATTTHVLSQFL